MYIYDIRVTYTNTTTDIITVEAKNVFQAFKKVIKQLESNGTNDITSLEKAGKSNYTV